jgi:hypothetical protein
MSEASTERLATVFEDESDRAICAPNTAIATRQAIARRRRDLGRWNMPLFPSSALIVRPSGINGVSFGFGTNGVSSVAGDIVHQCLVVRNSERYKCVRDGDWRSKRS